MLSLSALRFRLLYLKVRSSETLFRSQCSVFRSGSVCDWWLFGMMITMFWNVTNLKLLILVSVNDVFVSVKVNNLGICLVLWEQVQLHSCSRSTSMLVSL